MMDRPVRLAAFHALLLGLAACGAARGARTVPALERVEQGYGSSLRGEATGGTSSLSGEELTAQRVNNVEELLDGRVPGLLVTRTGDGALSVRVRGVRSLLGNNEPLVVIDGIPMNAPTVSQALSGLAPQSVARIDVLKDAGSTAAFGSRGANGVILVTTKR
jgi:TonB-dependent starch-binding outer membrane protein SusC